MSIQGNLATMKLPDLLRWAAENSETGVLELERNKVCKRIVFHEGRVIGCSSDDPPSRIGQFLLARGKITREALAQALEIQKESRVNLGAILQDMGVIEAEELSYELGAKAEENLFSIILRYVRAVKCLASAKHQRKQEYRSKPNVFFGYKFSQE